MARKRANVQWGWYLLVYAPPLLYWWANALAYANSPSDWLALIMGPFYLSRTSEPAVPIVAILLAPLFIARPGRVTGVLSAVGTYLWGAMGFAWLAGGHL